jgi:hypothetical protein
MNAFASKDYTACTRQLEGALGDVARIGGSHAQREIIEDTFIVALIRSGDLPRARVLLDQRLHRRPRRAIVAGAEVFVCDYAHTVRQP